MDRQTSEPELARLTQDFRDRYAAFSDGCAAAERDSRWNTEEFGSMEGYAFAALSGAILSLIVSDGNVGERETEYLDENFGFDYTVDDLLELYGYAAKDILANAAENAKEALRLIRAADGGLAEDFRSLLFLACEIISESDDGVNEDEEAMIRQLREAAE